MSQSSDYGHAPTVNYASPPRAIPRPPVYAIILSALTIPFLLALGGMRFFSAQGTLSRVRLPPDQGVACFSARTLTPTLSRERERESVGAGEAPTPRVVNRPRPRDGLSAPRGGHAIW